MLTAKRITEHFIERKFKPKRLKILSARGLKAFYKREELGYIPGMFTEEEFFELYAVHATNLGGNRIMLTEAQMEEGLTGGWVAPISRLSPMYSYAQNNYRPGHQVVLVPWPYVNTTSAFKIESGYKPRKEEVAIITDEVTIAFHGYDHNGVAFPYGIDFIKLFKVGTSIPLAVDTI